MKPRCEVCEKSLKNIYHRIGSKGKWESVTNWWYCSACNNMRHLPLYNISTDARDYLDKVASTKFPIIAQIRNEKGSLYVDIDELKEAVKSPNLKLKTKRELTSVDHRMHDTRIAWICSVCEEFELIKRKGLMVDMDKNDLVELQPKHCNEVMKLGGLNYFQMDDKFERMKNQLKSLLEKGEYIQSAELFLQYIFELFSQLFFSKIIKDFIFFSNNYPELQKTSDYKIIHYFLSLFARQNLRFEFNLVSNNALNNIHLSSFSKREISTILNRFEDIKKLIIKNKIKDSNLDTYKYYSIMWTIKQIILDLGDIGHLPDRTGDYKLKLNLHGKDTEK